MLLFYDRQTDRDRQSDRQTDRNRETETDKQRQRQTERNKDRDRDTLREYLLLLANFQLRQKASVS